MEREAVIAILRQAVADSTSAWPPLGSPIMEYDAFAGHVLDALDHAGFQVIVKADA